MNIFAPRLQRFIKRLQDENSHLKAGLYFRDKIIQKQDNRIEQLLQENRKLRNES